jgi:hypothetical protein
MYALLRQKLGSRVAISGAVFNQQGLVGTGQLNIAPVTRNARATFLLRPALQRVAPLLECSQSPSITGKACSGSRSTPELSPILKHDPCPFVVHVGPPLRRFLGSDLPRPGIRFLHQMPRLGVLGGGGGFFGLARAVVPQPRPRSECVVFSAYLHPAKTGPGWGLCTRMWGGESLQIDGST